MLHDSLSCVPHRRACLRPAGANSIVVVGGMESMSNAPYYAPKVGGLFGTKPVKPVQTCVRHKTSTRMC